jgi:hypothetical protein
LSVPSAQAPSLALSSAGVPRLAFVKSSDGLVYYAWPLNSTPPYNWTFSNPNLSPAAQALVATRAVSLAVDSGNRPHVAYRTSDGLTVRYAYRPTDTSAWELDLGATDGTRIGPYAAELSMVVASSGSFKYPKIGYASSNPLGDYQLAEGLSGPGGSSRLTGTSPAATDNAATSGPVRVRLGRIERNRSELVIEATGNAQGTLQVFDVAGRLCASSPVTFASAGTRRVDVPVSELSPGIYLARVRMTAGNSNAVRFPIMR